MSNSLQVASSDPVANACPLGKNCKMEKKNSKQWKLDYYDKHTNFLKTHWYCIDISFMSSKRLSAYTTPYIPQLEGGYINWHEHTLYVPPKISMSNTTYIYYARVVWGLFTLADESQAPDTNEFWSGPSETLITSPVCPAKVIVCCPDSISQSPLKGEKNFWCNAHLLSLSLSLSPSLSCILTNQVMSPDEVRIFPSSRKRHDDR